MLAYFYRILVAHILRKSAFVHGIIEIQSSLQLDYYFQMKINKCHKRFLLIRELRCRNKHKFIVQQKQSEAVELLFRNISVQLFFPLFFKLPIAYFLIELVIISDPKPMARLRTSYVLQLTQFILPIFPLYNNQHQTILIF